MTSHGSEAAPPAQRRTDPFLGGAVRWRRDFGYMNIKMRKFRTDKLDTSNKPVVYLRYRVKLPVSLARIEFIRPKHLIVFCSCIRGRCRADRAPPGTRSRTESPAPLPLPRLSPFRDGASVTSHLSDVTVHESGDVSRGETNRTPLGLSPAKSCSGQ